MIEFFKEPNIDWMGKAKYFFALSAILLLIGWFSIFSKGASTTALTLRVVPRGRPIFPIPDVDQFAKRRRAWAGATAKSRALTTSVPNRMRF